LKKAKAMRGYPEKKKAVAATKKKIQAQKGSIQIPPSQ
jgi:hypothetical protein